MPGSDESVHYFLRPNYESFASRFFGLSLRGKKAERQNDLVLGLYEKVRRRMQVKATVPKLD